MIKIGVRVRHRLQPKMTGIVIGYGTIENPWNEMTHAVYLVAMDSPIPVPPGNTTNISIQAWNPDHTRAD